jgi:hypothetical protein
MDKQDYLSMLEAGHAEIDAFQAQGRTSRLEYLSDHIFDFTTYETEMAELFATKALEVCAAISNRTTFDYIVDPDGRLWFLLMCNMPFFAGRLNWGTSIRGAWWDTSSPNETEFDAGGLWLDGEQVTKPLTLSTDQWREFIAALLVFGVEESNVK